MIDADVVVLGAGLAGASAALAAARHRQTASVHLLPTGGPDFGDGLVRVLAAPPTGQRPVVDPLAAVSDLPETHPYRVLADDALPEGLALFDDVTSDSYGGASSPENALVPTFHGAVTPAARYPAAVAPGLASREEPMLLAGFSELPDLSGPLAASRLRTAGVPFDAAGTDVSLPVDVDRDAPVLDVAATLDANPTVLEDRPLRDALADRVRPALHTADRVGFPAVLGREETASIHAAIAAALDVEVFEVPIAGPHLLGLRLRDHFSAALDEAGVRFHADARVGAADAPAGESIRVELRNGETLRAEAGVLATGGLAAGGIVADRETVGEPLFGCRVPHASRRLAWSEPAPFGDHEFARFGVPIDHVARPTAGDGEPEHERLFAAGSVVGGRNFVAEGSTEGVTLATAYVAGTRAVEAA